MPRPLYAREPTLLESQNGSVLLHRAFSPTDSSDSSKQFSSSLQQYYAVLQSLAKGLNQVQ